MAVKLNFNRSDNGPSTILEFSGAVDEDAAFDSLGIAATVKDLTISLAGVTTINSCGIRAWVKWVKSIPSTVKTHFVNNPKIVIDQVNMVDGFLPAGAVIESFQVPFFCEECENVTTITFNRGVEFKGDAINVPETVECLSCNKTAEIDVIESKYFRFLKNQPK